MAKASPQTKLVNGEIADADVVNQIVENVGSQGGLIPYDPTTNNQETNGSQSIGSTAFPWGSLFLNRLANLVEVDPSTNTAASSIAINLLRKFISMKDAPGNGTGSYTGNGGKFIQVNGAENGLQFAIPTTIQTFLSSGTFVCPAGITTVYLSGIAGGAAGNSSHGGNSGMWIQLYPYTVIPGNSYTVTIGSGGGNTVFDTLTLLAGSVGTSNPGGQIGISSPPIGTNGGGTPWGAGNTGNSSGTPNTGAGGGFSGSPGTGSSGLMIIEY